MKTEASETSHSFADDRLVGVEAIAKFIDPGMSLWKAQRLLEDSYYPSWREGRIYVASKAALCERWRQMTGGVNPHGPQPPPPKHDRAA